MKWPSLLFFVVISVSGFFVGANAKELGITKGINEDSGIEYQVEVLKDNDKGVYGLLIVVNNLNENDVILSMPSELSEFVMISIVTHKGEIISVPPKAYIVDGKECQSFSEVIVPKLGTHEWFVPIRSYIQHGKNLGNGETGRISITLVLDHKLTDKSEGEKNNLSSLDINFTGELFFTSQALEGNPYDKFKDRNSVIK